MTTNNKTVEQLEMNQQKFVDQGIIALVVLTFFVVLGLGVVFMNYKGFTLSNIIGVITVSSLLITLIVSWYEIGSFLKNGFNKGK